MGNSDQQGQEKLPSLGLPALQETIPRRASSFFVTLKPRVE